MSITNRLNDCLLNKESSEYVLPFFWQHGESHERLAEEIDAMERANVREFCVESRTHEDFGHEQWWIDFRFMLEEAKRRNMRVWLLDDKRFPTGYANGYIEDHPELRKNLIRMDWRDYAGPRKNVHTMALNIDEDESFVSIVAYKREQNGYNFVGEPIDLLPTLKNGLLSWDVPEGAWRVYFIIKTHKTVESEWIDPLNPESCQAMLKAVYEPHYERFSEYFVNTFVGFFSDEPRFGNDHHNYDTKLGKMYTPIPWRDDLPELIAEASGLELSKVRLMLPALFHPYENDDIHPLRCYYMDVCTKLYRDNFEKMLGEWCRERNMMYIGHIIEDMNTHQRMGYGAGHFFRALEYQSMGGMDIVLHQITPGMLDTDHCGPVGGNVLDPEFFHYLIAKLPTSQSHTNPRMEGRAMCEIFGAFGWAEGIPMMKQLTDHMLVNGINYYVPHAFSPKYPDLDCPPHFYAGGTNPQFDAFAELMKYMRRSAHLISGGTHRAPVAVMYNPEAEWAEGKCMFLQKVGRQLTCSQIDFDVLSEDTMAQIDVVDGTLRAGNEQYRAMIVPESEYLTRAMIDDLTRYAKAGLPIIVAGKFAPKACEDGTVLTDCTIVSLDKLSAYLRDLGIYDITITPAHKLVRYYRMDHGDGECYIFCSEDVYNESRFTVTLPEDREYRIYDPWKNTLYTPRRSGNKVDIYLPKSGMLFLITNSDSAPEYDYRDTPARAANLDVNVSISHGVTNEFAPFDAKIGDDITAFDGLDRFAGVIRYEGTIELTSSDKKLCLGEVGEIAQVWLNGESLGRAVCEPYDIELKNVKDGINDIRIDIINNLGYRERDKFSGYLTLPASGLIGEVTVR